MYKKTVKVNNMQLVQTSSVKVFSDV
jgi:hypothetical protein